METSTPTYSYKETRLDLDSTTQGSTVAIRLPTQGASIYPSRNAPKRPHIAEIPIAEDENAFRARHLASAASIYHRTHYQSPKSFLWRILEDGKVLSVQSVDISKPSTVADANITLRLTLPSAVKPGCIALADSKEHDVLSVFLLTESKQLNTLTLRPDHFRKAASTEDNVGDWCKTYSSAAFSLKAPHRMVALSADELLISTIDGALLRLERNSGGDGMAIYTAIFCWMLTVYRLCLEGGTLQRRWMGFACSLHAHFQQFLYHCVRWTAPGARYCYVHSFARCIYTWEAICFHGLPGSPTASLEPLDWKIGLHERHARSGA